jgi:hypothetical protein
VSLPTSRNRTYTVGSQVFSADLNDLQDEIIAKHVHNQFHSAVSGKQVVGTTATWGPSSPSGLMLTLSTTFADLYIPFPVLPGRLANIKVIVNSQVAAADTLGASCHRSNGTSANQVGSEQQSADSAADQVLTIATGHTFVADESYVIKILQGGNTGSQQKRVIGILLEYV